MYGLAMVWWSCGGLNMGTVVGGVHRADVFIGGTDSLLEGGAGGGGGVSAATGTSTAVYVVHSLRGYGAVLHKAEITLKKHYAVVCVWSPSRQESRKRSPILVLLVGASVSDIMTVGTAVDSYFVLGADVLPYSVRSCSKYRGRHIADSPPARHSKFFT